MTTLTEFRDVQERVETLKKEVSRAEGSFDRVLEELKDQFGCDSLDDAQKLSRKLEKDSAKLEKSFREELASFEEKWEHRLEGGK